jgi:hypothetical protein
MSGSISFFITFFRWSTIQHSPIATENGALESLRTQQNKSSSSSEPIIEQCTGMATVDCLLLWDISDRPEFIDQVEVIASGSIVTGCHQPSKNGI